ncbi:uncharacterized protein A4U43_C02F4920 [Asparagus officinalis]|uniref:LsmAD domain-containing protein n=1 Tax=Asparagus officinalis TaxID=4686 RepID=A0A5P1FL14_ASPOF|nr:polyadenylate-binding protein-interacting protein 4 isoform X2 [Asparagus officinalis]ONK77280.1 uncharacterized protein A4U43_C02F4920 [Asparagus officinalis]
MNAGLEENLKAKMNLQQSAHPRSSVNGYGRRKGDREIGPKAESKMHTGKVASSSLGTAENGGKSGSVINPSRDRLIYVISYLIGLRVEVHVRNGSIISGIFHATNAEKDFSIVLKMAQVIKDGSVKGHKPVPETVKKPMDMIIQAKDLVQVVAEDAPLNIEEFSNAHPRDKRKDLMIDSAISHSHHLEAERELERWTPDADDPECPELEDIFDGTWNRNWDQFQTNETLFGVKSTFDEELYTTKLERGPRTRELEREATRIAREIEGEDTRDLHLAEERGIQFDEDFDVDEEIKYSAVQREMDDQIPNNYSTENFGSSNGSTVPKSFSDISRSKLVEEAHTSPTCSSMNAEAPAEIHYDKDARHFGFGSKDDNIPSADIVGQKPQAVNDKSRLHEKQTKNEDKEKNIFNECIKRTAPEKAQASQDEVTQSSADAEKSCSSTVASIASASSQDVKRSIGEASDCTSVAIEAVDHSHRSRTALSSTSDRIAAGSVSSGSGLSPSSSIGSLSSEKSTLNPNAREFKLNPNAKSFTPTASFRPQVPISEGAFYYSGNISGVPPVHSVPMNVGIGPSYGGHQPVFNSQSAQLQSPQAYIHPSGPMYGQQMMLGQPRPVYYMPAYPPEMPYKGRNF